MTSTRPWHWFARSDARSTTCARLRSATAPVRARSASPRTPRGDAAPVQQLLVVGGGEEKAGDAQRTILECVAERARHRLVVLDSDVAQRGRMGRLTGCER